MVKHFKTAEFDAAVNAAPLALVDFWADWCGPCRMLAPLVDQLAGDYDGKVLVGKVNVDEEPELARRFEIPLRTVQDWHAGRRKAPDYVVKMIDRLLQLEK